MPAHITVYFGNSFVSDVGMLPAIMVITRCANKGKSICL